MGIFDSARNDPSGGINSNIFSSGSEITDIMKPKNGVKLKSNRAEVGSGRFVNPNPSKLSLAEYNDIATKN